MSILTKLTETSKIRLAVIAVVCILIFYAVGIATNLFASPVFSMFWIISAETAHGVVLYVSAGLAVVLGVGMATFVWLKKRDSGNSTSLNDLMLAVEKAKLESVQAYKPVTYKVAAKEESQEETKQVPSNAQPIREPVVSRPPNSTREAILASARMHEMKADSATKKKVGFRSAKAKQPNDKLMCTSCKKEVTQPLVIVNSDEKNPKISRYCPDCEKLLDEIGVNLHAKAKNTEKISFEVASFEEVYNK